MTNAFQQAAAQASQQTQTAPTQYAQPQTFTPPPTLAESIVEPTSATSQLFSGPLLPPSLLNKTNKIVGSERHGKIVKAPYDTHSRDFNSRLPKYWANTPVLDANGRLSKITTNPVDHVTGEKLKPVLDTVIEVATDYRFDAAEAAAVKRDPNLPDDGVRAFYVSGDDLKQVRNECRRLGIGTVEGMVGLTISVALTGLKPTSGEPARINKIVLSR